MKRTVQVDGGLILDVQVDVGIELESAGQYRYEVGVQVDGDMSLKLERTDQSIYKVRSSGFMYGRNCEFSDGCVEYQAQGYRHLSTRKIVPT
jgi:hypothetical protein